MEASAGEKYDQEKVNRSYIAASTTRTVSEWATQQHFVGINTRSLSVPAGASCYLYLLEPLQVLVV